MIFQAERIIIASLTQIWPIIYLSIFSYKLLKRSKNRSTITLSTFFLMLAIGYLLSIFSLLSINTPVSYVFYVISWYLFMLSHCFLVIFSWLLLHIEESIPFKKYLIFIVIYLIVINMTIWINIFHDGIQYDISTGWRPLFSFLFAIMNWIYAFFLLVIPEIVMSFKLNKIYHGSQIIIRIKLFLTSTFLEYVVIILLVLYNMLPDSHLYRSIHIFLGPTSGMLAAFFIYRSFGRKIE